MEPLPADDPVLRHETVQASHFSCNLSAMLNKQIFCTNKPVVFLSNLKYVGNGESGREAFLDFRELRIFDRIITHEEFTFYSRPDRMMADEGDSRVSHHDIVNLTYEEFAKRVGQKCNHILRRVMVSPGNNMASALEIFALMCRNCTIILLVKFKLTVRSSDFYQHLPLFFNDLDASDRRKKAVYNLLNAIV